MLYHVIMFYLNVNSRFLTVSSVRVHYFWRQGYSELGVCDCFFQLDAVCCYRCLDVSWNVCLSVGRNREPCKTAEPIETPRLARASKIMLYVGRKHWRHLANTIDRCAGFNYFDHSFRIAFNHNSTVCRCFWTAFMIHVIRQDDRMQSLVITEREPESLAAIMPSPSDRLNTPSIVTFHQRR